MCIIIITAITCTFPSIPNLKNQPPKTVFNFDEEYTLECATGYKPEGDSVMTCGNTGNFDKEVKCIGE